MIVASVFSVAVLAQQEEIKCYTDQMEEQLIAENPDLAQYFENYHLPIEGEVAYKTTGTVYRVPVVFHIIYDTEEDNISREQILDGLRVINEDYRRENADRINTRPVFQSVADDMEIEFVLAKLDPNGNCTEGITRTQSSLSVNANDNVKDLIHWDNKKYMNVWVVQTINSSGAPGIILGYAYKPRPGQSYKRDGILIRHDRLGTIGTGEGVSKGRTLTHEAGHYLGLDHPFRNGCNGGDGCEDTPPVASASFGCNHNQNTCSNDFPDHPDQVENYMDYADDYCTNMFTTDQKNIMRGSKSLGHPSYRGYLVTQGNYDATGITENQVLPCAPKADFGMDKTLICQGETVNFTDFTYMGNPVTYQWTFIDGTPSSSTAKNPTVIFDVPGSKSVSLVVTNANGSSQKYHVGAVSVRANKPVWVNGFSDDFETWDIPNNNWHIEQHLPSDMMFETTNNAGASGTKSAYLNGNKIITKEVHSLVTNAIDLTNSKSANLNFKHAYANKTSSVFGANTLKVYASTDCGETWSRLRTVNGFNLETASPTDNEFVPNGAGEWKDNSVIINQLAFEEHVMFKFEMTINDGNNFYLDDVMIDATIGEEEVILTDNSVDIFPNPTNGEFTLNVNLGISGELDVNIYNLNGQKVYHESIISGSGIAELKVNLSDMSSGMYMVKISSGDAIIMRKIILE